MTALGAWCGFLNVSKLGGITSHKAVAIVRKFLPKGVKIGHTGTLDPMATGVLPFAIGPTTRLISYLSDEKEYRATIRFGIDTDTNDITGKVLSTNPDKALALTKDEVESMLPQFVGNIAQVPPAFSAVHIDGARAYKLARTADSSDVESKLQEKTVTVHNIDFTNWRSGGGSDAMPFPEADVTIACKTGTYIRSIARDLGRVLGTTATLSSLHRSRSNGFAESLQSVDVNKVTQKEDVLSCLIPPLQVLGHLPRVKLSVANTARFVRGQSGVKIWSIDMNGKQVQPELDQVCVVVESGTNQVLGIGKISKLQHDWVVESVVVLDSQ
eukprot:c5158_g1_i1.p1 GENE.c5158_g1_i1~~c5158_g1_i1.p1  ORF type:complete len:340 (+),score=48.53 c5158_g1_i1:41-1021(+)